jgi:hypothetical protein
MRNRRDPKASAVPHHGPYDRSGGAVKPGLEVSSLHAGRRPRAGRCAGVALVVALTTIVGNPAWAAPRIVFERNGDLFTILPDGSGSRGLPGIPAREHDPAWSPDHGRIAFVTADRRIVVIDADGTDRRRLFLLPDPYDEVTSLSWSPDGGRIAFATARSTPTEKGWTRDCGQIWWMWADGRDPQRIVRHEPHVTGISWSPDGERLAVGFEHRNMTVACGDDRPLGIAIVRSDGTGLHGLGPRFATHPDWSPDGRWIAYRDWRRTCHACGEIWLIRPDGSRNHVFVPVPAEEGAWEARASPLPVRGSR